MKKIPIDQCLQCWHFDDDTYHCRQTGERLMNPYIIPTDCPLEDDLPESKDNWIPVSERLPEIESRVLGYRTKGYLEIVGIGRLTESPEWFKRNFTHWQPLPTPPTDQYKKEVDGFIEANRKTMAEIIEKEQNKETPQGEKGEKK